ncbi:MAG: hypothetical protein Q4C66_05345 [Lachnospiraceae bacterium]|nr:hypothetical protein [Lachnospiraceae bacterium]
MAEIITECKVIRVEMVCDKCMEGMMEPTGLVLTSYPPRYEHRCSVCGHEKMYHVRFPHHEIVQEAISKNKDEREIVMIWQ